VNQKPSQKAMKSIVVDDLAQGTLLVRQWNLHTKIGGETHAE
jgi:hypothetical protein